MIGFLNTFRLSGRIGGGDFAEPVAGFAVNELLHAFVAAPRQLDEIAVEKNLLFARFQPAGQDLGAQPREYGGRQAPDRPAVVSLADEQTVARHRAGGRGSTHFGTTPRDYSVRGNSPQEKIDFR